MIYTYSPMSKIFNNRAFLVQDKIEDKQFLNENVVMYNNIPLPQRPYVAPAYGGVWEIGIRVYPTLPLLVIELTKR